MITTKIDPPLLSPTFVTVVTVDTKANMLEAAEIWGFRFPKSWRKDELAQALDYHLKHSTQYIWDNLGQEAIDMIGEIQEAGKGNYITVPHDKSKYNRLQKSLLVIGKEEDATGECRLYMLDEVFDIFKNLTDGHLKMLTDATKIFADNKLKEINAAGKASDEAKPIVFRPALTKNPPLIPEEGRMIAYQLIRPRVMELTLRLSAERYMVCYLLMQEGYIHVACNWGNILDFVWNGVEHPIPGDEYFEVKRPFRKKYPAIARSFGQRVDDEGKCLPEPYITTLGFDHQPKTWYISYKIYGLEFTDLAIFGPMVDDEYAAAIGNLRDLCIKFFQEIMRSDAKKPKALMQEYFGIDSLPIDEDFEGLGLCVDPRDMTEDEQEFPVPPGMNLHDIKDAIVRLMEKRK